MPPRAGSGASTTAGDAPIGIIYANDAVEALVNTGGGGEAVQSRSMNAEAATQATSNTVSTKGGPARLVSTQSDSIKGRQRCNPTKRSLSVR